MNNFSRILQGESDYRSHDIECMREKIPLLRRCSGLEIVKLYEAYSDASAAGWLILDDETISSFAGWLES